MSCPMSSSHNTHFTVLNMGSVNWLLHQKLVLLASFFWVLLSTLFGLLNKAFFRVKEAKSSSTNNSSCEKFDSTSMEKEIEAEEPVVDPREDKREEESPQFFFKFKYQTYREDDEPIDSNPVLSTCTNKYDFLSGKDLSHYLKEPDVVSLTVKELFADSDYGSLDTQTTAKKKLLSEGDFMEQNAESKSVHEELPETSPDILFEGKMEETLHAEALSGKKTENLEAEKSIGGSFSARAKAVVDEEKDVTSDEDASEDNVQFLSEKDFFASDSDFDSIASSHDFMSRFLVTTSDAFLSDTDFEDPSEVEPVDEDLELDYSNLQNLNNGYEADDFEEEDADIMEELRRLDKSNMQNLGNADLDKLSEKDFVDDGNSKREEVSCNADEPTDSQDNSGKSNSQNSSAGDSEDSSALETLWEHQELMEQLKMELKKVRATGLPTILEEDECPKIMEDLKPWKINEKFHHQDRMGELHKFYRSYRERMRKLDILNYQKMYAANFLQAKNPLISMSSQKAPTPELSKATSQRFLLYKRKKYISEPMMNFVKELHSDLEVVYVGQMCLSWEILRWQYEKVLELWDSDPYGMRRYNEVAGEFQQFQVLLQRFIENEPFEDPRVQYYIKHRCVLRNLLQVPVVREDSKKGKKARTNGKDDGVITSDMLVEIMEESIRIFWRFVRADKDTHTPVQKGRKGTQVEPQDSTELELLTEVRTSLLKKEKRLKEILRGGNCILRKFRKHQEDSSDHVLHFFSQVDMKLVSRVINMSKTTTDQLLWCHNKLSRIAFVRRKIQVEVEPSFLLFPC